MATPFPDPARRGRGGDPGRGIVRFPLLALLLPATIAAQEPQGIALLRGQVGVDPEPGSLLATPARLTVNELPLPEALSRLAERSRVRIAFSPALLPEDHRVRCDCADLSTARALDRLLMGTGLGYVELGPQIVLVPLAPPEPPPLNGTIRGRVRTEVAFSVEDAAAHPLTAAYSAASRALAQPNFELAEPADVLEAIQVE